MFENKTFAALLEIARSYAPEWVDASEGSVYYDCVAPLCMLMAEHYADLELLQRQLKPTTATGTWLEAKCEEYGLLREKAVPWIYIYNHSGGEVRSGDRFFAEGYYYVIRAIDGSLYAECETAGTIIPRLASGTALVPVYTIEGLETSSVGEVYRYAADTETDDALRTRLQETLAQPSENANVAQVKRWAMEFEGVKSVKVYGRAIYDDSTDTITKNVPNRVVIFISVDEGYIEVDVVTGLQKYIDPDAEGNGEGAGIIGTVYKVYALIATTVSISCTLYLDTLVFGENADIDEVKEKVVNKITDYYNEITDETGGDYLYIYRDNVKTEIQEIEGVKNCDNLILAGYSSNIKLPAYKRPICSASDLSITIVMEASDNDFEEL